MEKLNHCKGTDCTEPQMQYINKGEAVVQLNIK